MAKGSTTRDHIRLISAMNTLLGTFSSPADDKDVLFRAVADAARGLGAERHLLLLVPDPQLPRARVIISGGLGDEVLRATERGDGIEGPYRTLTAAAIASGQMQSDDGSGRTPAVCAVCAPILDQGGDRPTAILYLEQDDPSASLCSEMNLTWIGGFAAAISRLFAHYLQRLRLDLDAARFGGGERPDNAPDLIGESPTTQALRRELHETYVPAAAAPDPDPVLVLGEKGTGKDLIARYIHAYSGRRRRPFIAVNCAEITAELAAARFFGHRKGSFTGAVADELGLFRAAHGGVLFLDEIAELTPAAQATLLRVLENRTVVPIGETRETRIDVQVILATNRDLDAAMAEGQIKPDLVDRFRTQAIHLAPIRSRPADIPPLVRHFVAHHSRRMRKPTGGIDDEAMAVMVGYTWPGNVREIARVCSLLLTHLKPGARLDKAVLGRCYPQMLHGSYNPKSTALLFDQLPLRDALRELQRQLILSRLERHNWNVRSTRESLGLPKTTFHRYALGLGIAVQELKLAAADGG